jgi:DNA-binding transcriptional regulator LsrR (DeoR family)
MRPRQSARTGVRTHRPGPEELVQTAAIARLFYLENKSKIEIAEEFGISRFKVARMLENALRDGLIRLEIHLPAELDADISDALRIRFGLTRAIVFTSPELGPGGEGLAPVTHRLGAVAADLLTEIVTEGDVLGLVWDPRSRRCAPNSPRCPAVQSCS